MKFLNSHLGRTVLASAALALLVASCGGDNSDDSSAAGGNGSSGGLVSVASVDGTDVLVDADGHTLYSADVEKGGRIKCVEACTSFWEPVAASAADVEDASTELSDELGLVDRPDGESQLTYDGLPLYTFVDEDAGELKGDGFTDDFGGNHFEWSAARTDKSTGQTGTPTSGASDDTGGGSGY
jgi:predicted lipoprotein with Yx(FWY)xxD motif